MGKPRRKKNKMAVHFSSATDDWATPQDLFDELNAKYGPFELDVAASEHNAKCDNYYCERWNGLVLPWTKTRPSGVGLASIEVGQNCWMNPPYGREIGKWVKKAYEESTKGCLVVALLPARTDTQWFHSYIYGSSRVSVEFLKGRLKFGDAKNAAPFPSMVVVFRPPDAFQGMQYSVTAGSKEGA